MKKSVQEEIKRTIKELKLNCTIREFKYEVDWYNISINQKLSENFIREFKDYVNWYNISIYQKLSEEFIREFKDKVCWSCISKYQNVSLKFLGEFGVRIDNNQKIDKTEIKPSDNHKCISRLFGLVRCHKFVSVYNEKEELPESVISSANRSFNESQVLKAGKLKHKVLVSTYCKYCGLKV